MADWPSDLVSRDVDRRAGRVRIDLSQVARFLDEFRELTRTASNETELRTHFVMATDSQLSIRDLKLERERQDVRRNRVIIEFKDKGLL